MGALSDVVTDDFDRPIGSPEYDEDVYWAAREKEYIACEITTRIRDYYERLDSSGMLRLYRETHAAFYGLDGGTHVTSQIVEFGDDGEKLGVRSNQLRSLVKFVYLAATQNKPVVKPRAKDSTPAALAQIPTARRLLEYYDRVKKIERELNACALRALLYGKGYLWQSFDPGSGAIGPDGRPLGDLMVKAAGPTDVACDLDVENQDHDWFAVRVRRNRYDLVAMYASEGALSPEGQQNPDLLLKARELKSKILNCESDVLESKVSEQLRFYSRRDKRGIDRDDSIYEYHFMHRRTPALPEGRYVIVTADDTLLFEGPLPYDNLTIDMMCPEEFLEMGDVGYSSAWDLLGMQQAYDSVMSVCLTNHEAFGHNDILLPEGVEVGYEELRDGLNLIRYPAGEANKPSMLEKFSIKDEAFKLKDWLKGDMELALSVNSVARGEPEKSLESGAALALVQAQAISAQSPFVKAFQVLVGDSATNRIRIIQKHLPEDRVVAIAGTDDPDSIQAFVAGGVSLISHIECESVSPLFSTIAGKQNAADKMLERGLITSAAGYLHFQETGRLELVTDDQRRKDLFGRRVREILMQGPAVSQRPDPMSGQPVQFVPECRYLITDDPRICIAALSSVLDQFQARENESPVLAACLAYQDDVLNVWRNADPALMALLGYPSAPALAMDPAAQGGGGGQKPPGGDKGGPGNGAPGEKPTDQKAPAEGTSMPSLPKPAENPQQ